MVNASALGNEQSKITIVEFADYQCPFCAQFHKETRDSIIENVVDTGKAKFYIRILL
jgi:protein-disulfide isomerase